MMKGLASIFISLLLGIVCHAAEGEFRYTLLVNGQSVNDSLFVFGRSTAAANGIDELDFPAVPNYGGDDAEAPADDLYFRAQPDAETNDNASHAYSRLYTDMRSAATNATTWTICTYGNRVALSWEGKYYDADSQSVVVSPLASGGSTLSICDGKGDVIVADMRETTSCTLAANGVYNIIYKADDSVSSAPETPEELLKKFALMDEGSVSKFKILDVEKYSLVDWTLNFYNGTERLADKTVKMSDGNVCAAYDAATGVFSFIQPADFGAEFTEFRLEYSFKYLNFTRAGEEGVAIGTLRAVRASTPIMELDDDSKALAIHANSAVADDKTVEVKFNFMVDKDYQKTMTENIVLVGQFALPQWTYRKGFVEDCPWRGWLVSKGEEQDGFEVVDSIERGDRKDGDVITTSLVFTAEHPLMTITPTEPLGNFAATLTLVGGDRCASGTVAFTGSYIDVDGGTVNLPAKDDAPDTLTATVTVEKFFSASDGSVTVNDWVADTSVSTEADTFTYEDGNGGVYAAGGAVTAIDDIALFVDGTEVKYDAETYGGFAVSDGGIVWDGLADIAAIAHRPLLFNVYFTAKAADADYVSSGMYSLLVFPGDSQPYIVDFTIGTLAENELVTFSFRIVDPDGDDPLAYDDTVTLNGTSLEGVFDYSNEDDVWTFTSSNVLSFDMIAHTITDKNSDGVCVIPWTISFEISDVIERIFVTQSSDDDTDAWIVDVDRVQGTPTIVGYSPANPTADSDITVIYNTTTDADGDDITYSVRWTCGEKSLVGETLPASQTAKGETWFATVVATTTPYGDDEVTTSAVGAEFTIGNSRPAIAGGESINIHKAAGQAEAKGSIEFTVTDSDADDFTVVLGDAARGSVEASEVVDGKFTVTYSVNDIETAFDSDTFTVKVNDGEDDSDEIIVSVAFMENEPAAVVPVGDTEIAIDEVDADGNETVATLKIMATDTTEVSPYGIKSIAWSVTGGDGVVITSESTRYNVADATGNYPLADEMEVTVATKGYDTLSGPDRAATATYTVKVDVTDGVGIVTSQEFAVTVKDVDRPPTPPADIDAEYSDGNKTGTSVFALGKGAVDPDGDVVGYVYSLYVNGELVEGPSEPFEEDEEVGTETLLVKCQKPEVKVKAVSKPAYEGAVELSSEEVSTGELEEIANSAPVLAAPEGGVGEVVINEYVAGYNEANMTLAIGADDGMIIVSNEANDTLINNIDHDGGETTYVDFAYSDIDETAEVDNVTVTVNGDGLADYATVAIVDGKLVIMRVAGRNTAGLEGEERPYFTLTATDESGESVEAKFYVTVNPINEKPVVTVSTIGVTYGALEGRKEFEVAFGESADEADQTIAEIVDIEMADESGIIADYALAPSEDGKKVVLTYKGSENIEELADKEATLTFKVKDNGGTPFDDTSDAVTVTFIAGKEFYNLIFNGKVYDGVEVGEECIGTEYGVWDGMKFDRWEVEGIELEDDALNSPVLLFNMPRNDVVVSSLFTELGFEVPDGWTMPETFYAPMVVLGTVALSNGYSIDDDNTLVAVFDDDGNCYGVGAPNNFMSAKFGRSVYYLLVAEGAQNEGLTLKFWNLLTNEIIDINEKLDFVADGIVGLDEPLEWTAKYYYNDTTNPNSPFYNPSVLGDDIEGTEFSVLCEALWQFSPISFDFKMRLHNSATANYDEEFDSRQPTLDPPPSYEEYACFVSDDDVPLQIDSRPADGRHAKWTMRVVVPEGNPAVIAWVESSIPAVWNKTIRLFNDEGQEFESTELVHQKDDEDIVLHNVFLPEPGVWYLVFDFFDTTGLDKFTYNLVPGWNLISPTMNLADESIDALMALGLYVYDEENNSYRYASRSDIVPGKALWIFHHGERALDVWGVPDDEWQLSIGGGWSLVGVVEDIAAEELPSDIVVMEWCAGAYRPVEGGLEAGKAYWMLSAE